MNDNSNDDNDDDAAIDGADAEVILQGSMMDDV